MADNSKTNNHFNVHMLNLKNFGSVGAHSDLKVSKKFSRMYNAQLQRNGMAESADESAKKSLEALQQVVQSMVNEDVKKVLQRYVVEFFEPAFANIESNNNRNLDKELMSSVVCRRLLEDAIVQVYPLPSDLKHLACKTVKPLQSPSSESPNSCISNGLGFQTDHTTGGSDSQPSTFQDDPQHSANQITEMLPPPTIAGRLRSLKSRKRSFSDSEHVNVPPRSARLAAMRANEKVSQCNCDSYQPSLWNKRVKQEPASSHRNCNR